MKRHNHCRDFIQGARSNGARGINESSKRVILVAGNNYDVDPTDLTFYHYDADSTVEEFLKTLPDNNRLATSAEIERAADAYDLMIKEDDEEELLS